MMYGKYVNAAGSSFGDAGTRVSGTEDTPKLYYTTSNVGVAQDNKGTLRNIYSEVNSYSKILIGGRPHLGITGYEMEGEGWDDKPYDIPYAIQAGFLSGARYGVEDKNFPLNTEKRFSDKPITSGLPFLTA